MSDDSDRCAIPAPPRPRRLASVPPLTDEEEARIQAGIANDPDNPEWTEEDFAQARPFAEVFPDFYASRNRNRRH